MFFRLVAIEASLPLHAQATRTKVAHTTVGEEGQGSVSQLNAVVELMLDITESSVAFCWELGAGKVDTSKFCNVASQTSPQGLKLSPSD